MNSINGMNSISGMNYYDNDYSNISTDKKLEPLLSCYNERTENIAKLQMEQRFIRREISYVINSSQNTVLAPSIYDCAYKIWSNDFEKQSKNELYKQLNLLIKYAFPKAYNKGEGRIKIDKQQPFIVQGYDAYKIQIPLLYKTKPFRLYVARLHQFNGDNIIQNINDIYKCTHSIMYNSSDSCISIYNKSKFDLSDLDEILCEFMDDIDNKKIVIYKSSKNK